MVARNKRLSPAAKLAARLTPGELETVQYFICKDHHAAAREVIGTFLACSPDEAKTVHEHLRSA